MVAKNRQKAFEARRNGQRGAALLTCLLISTMLLGIAGMVILTTGMSATTSVESTAEMQAYYGAEAGVEATLNVLRGNVAPRAGLPVGTRIGFRNAVQLNRSNLPTDTSAVARLSGWLPYDANGLVVPAGTNFAYNVTLVDPDDWDGSKMAADANYSPNRLLVRTNGFGPRGATKRMEMVVTRVIFNFKTVAALAMRSADDNVSEMTFTIGNSNAKDYSGHDFTGTQTALPSFVVTGPQDVPVVEAAITQGSTVAAEQVRLLPVADLPEFLQTANNARAFLSYMESVSYNLGRHYTSFSGHAGTSAAPQFTFVNGDCNLDGGAGLLLVTGKLTMNGTPNFDGIILVMGEGNVDRDGSGNGKTLGTVYVARFARSWPASENADPHPFLAPTFTTNGAGTMDLRYDSPRVRIAENVMGSIVRDIREY